MSRFKIITSLGEGFIKDRGSKFYGYAVPVKDEKEAEERIKEYAKKHPKSRHVCYAYRIYNNPPEERASDAGEPSNTAGMPILSQIKGKDLYNILVVVIRYFGGTLLGKGGLIRAYGNAASLAIESSSMENSFIQVPVQAAVTFDEMDIFIRLVKENNWKIIEQKFTHLCTFTVGIPDDETLLFREIMGNLPSFKPLEND